MEICMRNPPSVNILLSFEERRRFTDFLVVLIAVDRRVTRRKAKAKKRSKTKTKRKEIDSQMRVLFFMSNQLFFLQISTINYY